jgi:hypothetical protein
VEEVRSRGQGQAREEYALGICGLGIYALGEDTLGVEIQNIMRRRF